MELRLAPEEAALVGRILTNYLADLRMEISDTDSQPMREALKRDEARVARVIEAIRTSWPG
jgi:hypothetical protein